MFGPVAQVTLVKGRQSFIIYSLILFKQQFIKDLVMFISKGRLPMSLVENPWLNIL
jgi:hypothetical protein